MNSATSSNGPTLYPTLVGYIETDQDKSSIIDACLSGDLHHIPRFPQQHELRHLIRSGNIFVLQIIQLGTDIGMMAKVGHLWDGKMDCISNGSTMDPDALMKKSGTLIHEGVSQHFVSYYKIKHILNGTLKRPSQTTNLRTGFASLGSGSSPLILKK